MPVISSFYGLIVMMYYFDMKQHHTPHIHVWCQGDESIFAIHDGNLIMERFRQTNKNYWKHGLNCTGKS